jgi:DNA-binding SARP family transcriptional activator/DNA polymerase III delta prime subunit
MHLSLKFFGSFQAALDGQPITHFRSVNGQGLLVYLALQAERPFPRDVLATLFWPMDDDSTARRNLRQTLYQLRQLLQDSDEQAEPFLLVTRHTAQFNSASDYSLDVHELLNGLATRDLAMAVSHYHGELLPGFTCDSLDFEEWLRGERERLHRLALEAMTDLTAEYLEQGNITTARASARRQLALEPWRELAHRQLMQALAAAGERKAALDQYQSCITILADELGLEPSPETTAVYQTILSGQYASGNYATPATPPHPERNQPTKTADLQAQRILLDKVHTFWVEGVLQQAMVSGHLLDVGLETVPEAVANPWQDVVWRLELPHRPIPPDTSMMEVFEENDRSLLILGEPGSGKTVALLQLAQALISQARQDENEPIPVIFNLSSWAHQAKPLAQWLADELNEKYLIPKKIAQSWLAEERLLLLLDGLDEVETSKLADCVTAVNDFRQAHGLVPLALCCRYQVYQEIDIRLRVNGAVRLNPLTASQTEIYLNQSGDSLAGLRRALHEEPALQELAQSPLMLQVMSKAFQPGTMTLPTTSDHKKESWLERIFEAYVGQMLAHLAATSDYTAVPARQWLTWLAQKMSARNQTVFLVEGIQPGWLKAGWERWFYLIVTRVLLGLIVGLILWLFGLTGRQMGIANHSQSSLLLATRTTLPLVWIDLFMSPLIHALYGALVTAVDFITYEKRQTNVTTPSYWDWRRKIIIALVVGLAAYVQLRLFGEQPVLLVLQVWTSAFMFVLVAHFALGQGYHDDVSTVEALSWSWQASKRRLLPSFLIGLLFSLIVWQLTPTERTLAQIILLIGIPIMLLVLSLFGLTNNQVETKVWPNQGIRLSVKNAFMGGSMVGIIVGGLCTIGGLILRSQAVPVTGVFGLFAGLIATLIGGLAFGGFNVINHFLLRLLLWRDGHMPIHYVAFLNEASRHVLLYKVGGGYIFIHRLLQEHLAQTKADETVPPGAAAVPVEKVVTKFVPSKG